MAGVDIQMDEFGHDAFTDDDYSDTAPLLPPTDDTPFDTFTPPGGNLDVAETSFGGNNTEIDAYGNPMSFPEDVFEDPNHTPAWAASNLPSGLSEEDLADAEHTKALVDRWERERGKVQQNLEFASSKRGDLWLRWGNKWLLITNKNKPGEFLKPSTIKRYRVDVAKALGVHESTKLSPQDTKVLKKKRPANGRGVLDTTNSPDRRAWGDHYKGRNSCSDRG